jgi:glycosyltransferase involved in cell wall biosynthesis
MVFKSVNFKLDEDKIILVILPYYNRPNEVLRALESLAKQTFKNWRLAFIDDGSKEPGESIVRGFLTEQELKKVFFYNTNDTPEIKKQRAIDNPDMPGADDKNAGSFFVPFINLAISDIKHDVALFLSDDDFLQIDYLEKLNNYYNHHEDIPYSFCNLILFDVKDDKMLYSSENNRFSRYVPTPPYFNFDGSQVSWTKQCYEDGCRFSEDIHVYWDAEWFKILQDKYGLCNFNKLIGQFKNFDSKCFYYE